MRALLRAVKSGCIVKTNVQPVVQLDVPVVSSQHVQFIQPIIRPVRLIMQMSLAEWQAVAYRGHGHDPAHSGQSTARTVTSFCYHNMATVWDADDIHRLIALFRSNEVQWWTNHKERGKRGEPGFRH